MSGKHSNTKPTPLAHAHFHFQSWDFKKKRLSIVLGSVSLWGTDLEWKDDTD